MTPLSVLHDKYMYSDVLFGHMAIGEARVVRFLSSYDIVRSSFSSGGRGEERVYTIIGAVCLDDTPQQVE